LKFASELCSLAHACIGGFRSPSLKNGRTLFESSTRLEV
jgi:hypothetical protein